ncbi:esterase FrsA [Erwinia sp. HR93]|uniref:esterase FrsA n=1 Tax=Erwinia sp. HR93 TaxID=3094840 RepID=UPI002ADEF5D4|nr:esterase FrsA [Erwinia sp. HR93]MEA1063825.1 esterase FrsA [Erwinia sp. HR93]
MPQSNLSEELFKPHFKHPETSTLIRRAHHHATAPLQSALDGRTDSRWYRLINRLLWVWRGVSPLDILDVEARIATCEAARSNDALLDTVIGYRSGNWVYEWSHQAMLWQQRAAQQPDEARCGADWLAAANLYSIAAYPYLKGDTLAEQAQALANRAYEEAASKLSGELRELQFPTPDGGQVTGFLHVPKGAKGPHPVVLMCGGLDTLQSDFYPLFERYLAPAGIAMLTIDMPSVGFSSKWKLTQDSSLLHQCVLQALVNVPWVDHTRVAAFGFRFGANVAVRLAYLEAPRLRAVACLGPVVHALMCEPARQHNVPDMYIDVLASRLGMQDVSDSALSVELQRYSLKMQGLLGRRCPVPMLSGYWRNDPFSPEDESRLIASSSADGKALEIATAPLYAGFDRALKQIVSWMAKRLNG